MKTLVALFAVVFTMPAQAQFRSTLCQTGDQHVARDFTPVRRLLACGPEFADNTLWHLDRADSRTGALDGRTYVPATGKGVIVYLVDTDIRAEHVELMRATGSIVIETVTIGGTPPAGCPGEIGPCTPGSSHGTAVESIIGGANVGVAPDVRIVLVVAGPTRYRDAMRAIAEHANGPAAPAFRTAVVSISGGYSSTFTEHDQLRAEIEEMVAGVDGKRFVFVVAIGNAPTPCPNGSILAYPAMFAPSIDGVISVGAITKNNEIWSGSCGGTVAEVFAPGVDIFMAAATANDHYLYEPAHTTGTSYAAPYVTGMTARILEQHPDLTPAEVEARLKASPSHVHGVPVPVVGIKRRAVH